MTEQSYGSNRPGLHIPSPSARPGENPTFEHLHIPPAGIVPKPPVDVDEHDIRDLPYTLIRVLDDDHRAVGEWDPALDADFLERGLRAMVQTRMFDDRMFRAHRQGKTSFYVKSTGEEAIAAAASLTLATNDMCFPTYRMMAWLWARDFPISKFVNHMFSNAEDPMKGRQLPVLFSARDYGFYSLSGNLGSRYGHAVGWAMAAAYRGDPNIAFGMVGEGTTAEGNVHEAFTFAEVYRAPCVLGITNNQWAISSFSGIAGAEVTTFAAKALAYGLPGLRVDGNDFLAVVSVIRWAAQRARAGLGTTLIEFFTYRVAGHSTSDDPTRYRPADEAEQWPLGDPIDRLKSYMIASGMWDDARHAAMVAEIDAKVRAGIKESEAIGSLGKSKPPLSTMFDDVFAEPDWRVIEQKRELGA